MSEEGQLYLDALVYLFFEMAFAEIELSKERPKPHQTTCPLISQPTFKTG